MSNRQIPQSVYDDYLAALVTYAPTWDDIECPVHRRCIGPFIAQAVASLSTPPFVGRCISSDPYWIRGAITLEAWHLYWSQTDTRGHDPGDEDTDEDPQRWERHYISC